MATRNPRNPRKGQAKKEVIEQNAQTNGLCEPADEISVAIDGEQMCSLNNADSETVSLTTERYQELLDCEKILTAPVGEIKMVDPPTADFEPLPSVELCKSYIALLQNKINDMNAGRTMNVDEIKTLEEIRNGINVVIPYALEMFDV